MVQWLGCLHFLHLSSPAEWRYEEVGPRRRWSCKSWAFRTRLGPLYKALKSILTHFHQTSYTGRQLYTTQRILGRTGPQGTLVSHFTREGTKFHPYQPGPELSLVQQSKLTKIPHFWEEPRRSIFQWKFLNRTHWTTMKRSLSQQEMGPISQSLSRGPESGCHPLT